ncbi:MAG: hypothetical protein QOD40_3232 [Alphaproteobacteria bacterium]|nr:hypothetical protein [Alphaproteobacteria bacterium]
MARFLSGSLRRAAAACALSCFALLTFGAAPAAWAQEADLSLNKSAPASAAADTDIVYTLTGQNLGPDAADVATVTDPLPSGLTFVSVSSPAGWLCSTPAVGATGTVACTDGSPFAPGDTAVFTLVVHIPPATAPGTVFTNIATISSNTFDPNSENDSGIAGTTVTGTTNSADLSISKSAPAIAAPDANITYTLTVANSGPNTAVAVQVNDTLPGDLTFVSMSTPAGWSCSNPGVGNGGTVTCSIGSFPSGGQATITLVGHVPSSAPDGMDYHNTARIFASETPDPNPENNDAVADTTVIAGPDLTITKTHTGNAQQGQTGFQYTITVSNIGNSASSGTVSVSDTLPPGLTATAAAGSGWNCSVGATSTCTRSDALPAGSSYPTITLTVNVAPDASPTVTNTATVNGGGDTNDTNNSASDSTTVAQLPDLTITKTHSGNAQQGQTGFTYTITVSNVGFGPSSGTVTVSDTVPTGLTATAVNGSGWSCSAGATSTCTRSDALAAGTSYPPITLTVNVASNAPASVTNTATVSGGGDSNNANNSASDPTTVTQLPDLTITKTHSGTAQQGQTGFTYTITVSNVGAGPSSGTVTVNDTVPTGLTATAVSGSGWSCSAGATSTCTRSDALASGASYPAITLTVNVASNAPASVTNTATVSGGGDPNNANNTATDQTAVTQLPDLTITKTHTGSAQQGQTGFTYTITVSNVGSAPSSGTVTVSDTVPAGLTATAISGSGWSCSVGATSTCTRSDAVAAGASYPAITLTVNVASNAPTSVTNTATVSGGGDSNNANNTANDQTTITAGPVPDLTITKTHTGNAQQGQTGFTYTITVSNVGNGASAGAVTVSDTVPTGLTATAISGTGWTCSVGATSTCTRSDALAIGASYPAITLTVNVASNAPASVTNTATVSGGGDTNASNNTANDATTVAGALPDLAVTKTHTGSAQQGQTGFTYTITVNNVGLGPTNGTVTVSDALPTGLTATAASGTGWTCSVGTTSTCTRSDVLASGASYPAITLTVNVASNAPASVTNTATVSGGGDTNAANNTATDATTVIQLPDLTITKTHTGNAQQGQVGFTYTITVNNIGPGPTSSAVTVSDTLPTGMTATAISGTGWSCSTGATSTCTRSDALSPGASYPAITLTVNVALTAPASVTNTATVSGGGDPNSANNTANDPTTVTPAPAADFTITKTHTGNPRQGQIGFTYTLTVSNVGLAASAGVVTVTDVLPSALTATAAAGGGWACSVGPTSTCTRSDALAVGAAYPPITLSVNVAPDAVGTITNTATVTGAGDINAANNTASDQATVRPRPDPTKDPDVVGLINAQIAEAQRFANAQLTNFNERMEHLHDESTNGDQQSIHVGLPYSDPCGGRVCCPPACIPGINQSGQPSDAFAYAPSKRGATASKAPKQTGPRADFAFWSAGYVSFGNTDATTQRSEIGFNTSGVSAGLDYRFAPHAFAGIGVGYGYDTTKIGTNGTRSRAQAYNVAAYGTIKPFSSAFFIDGVAGYGALKFDSQRFVVDDAAFVFGNRTGSQVFTSLTAGYEFRQGKLMLAPYARMNATWLTLGSFTETGGFGGALNYSSQSANFLTSVVGLRGKYLFLTSWGAFAPRFRLEYNHDFQGSSDIALHYADSLSGPTFNLTTTPMQRDHVTVGLGTDFIFTERLKLSADYQRDIDALGAGWHRFKLRLDGRY